MNWLSLVQQRRQPPRSLPRKWSGPGHPFWPQGGPNHFDPKMFVREVAKNGLCSRTGALSGVGGTVVEEMPALALAARPGAEYPGDGLQSPRRAAARSVILVVELRGDRSQGSAVAAKAKDLR